MHSGSYTFTISFFRDFSANSSYSIFFSLTKKSGTELKQSSKLMKCVVNIVNPLTWFADSYLTEHFPRTYVMKMPPYLASVNLNRQCYSNWTSLKVEILHPKGLTRTAEGRLPLSAALLIMYLIVFFFCVIARFTVNFGHLVITIKPSMYAGQFRTIL